MKIVTTGWAPIFGFLPRWERLPLAARQYFLELEGTLKVSPRWLDRPEVAALRDDGFLSGTGEASTDGVAPFRRFVRALSRHRLFDNDTVGLRDYLSEHLTHADVQSVQHLHGYYGVKWDEVAETVSDESWILGFLNETSPAKWEVKQGIGVGMRFLEDAAAGRFLTDWIRRLLEQGNPMALSEIAQAVADNPEAAGAALTAGVRYAFLYPALRTGTLDPVIGLLPGVHRRLTRKRPAKPIAAAAPPAGAEVFDAPYLMQDMTTLLVLHEPDGVRLTAQGDVFKREAERMIAALPELPANFGLPSAGLRWANAMNWLRLLGFTKSGERGKSALWMKATAAGRKWLAGTAGERLRALLNAMLADCVRNRKKERNLWERLPFAPGGITSRYGADGALNPEFHLVEAFDALEPGQWVAAEEFLAWQAETANPIFANRTFGKVADVYTMPAAHWEQSWRQYVKGFLEARLVPLGGVRLAVAASGGGRWFALTPVGAYLLGRTEEFQYVESADPGKVVVQPNFEIVFTGPAPAVEGELALFSGRVGHGVGTLFRITRTSVLAAVEAGVAGEEILERLSRCSHKPVPANVAAQVKDWAASHRRVTVRKVLTLECPDAETAARVRALFPQLIQPLAGTLLEITNPESIKAVSRKLKAEGIGVRMPKG